MRLRTTFALPALFASVLLVVAPLGILFAYSFWKVEAYDIVEDWNLGNYIEAFDRYSRPLLTTLQTGAVVGIVTVLLALPLAYACRYKLGRWQSAALFVILVSIFGGYLVRIYAWRTILGREGVINSTLLEIGLIEEPLQVLLFSRFAVILTLANFLLPFAFLPIYMALQALPQERIDASHDLGAGRCQTTVRLVLPEIAPAIAVAFSLCFVLAAGDYVTPTLVGGTKGTMIGQVIVAQFGNLFNWPLGAALAFSTALLLAAGIIVAMFSAWAVNRQRGQVC